MVVSRVIYHNPVQTLLLVPRIAFRSSLAFLEELIFSWPRASSMSYGHVSAWRGCAQTQIMEIKGSMNPRFRIR